MKRRCLLGLEGLAALLALAMVSSAVFPPQRASADPVTGSIVLDTEDISNFTLVGTQAPATGPHLLFTDALDADVSGLYAVAPWVAFGATVDLIATFQVTSQVAHGVDAGFQLVVNDGVNNRAAIMSAILINNLPHIGLVGVGRRDQLAAYPAFIRAEWQAAELTVHLRRWADGSFEILELNGALPPQPVVLSAPQLPPATRALGSIDFGAFSPQAVVNASVSELRAFTVPEPVPPPQPEPSPQPAQPGAAEMGDGPLKLKGKAIRLEVSCEPGGSPCEGSVELETASPVTLAARIAKKKVVNLGAASFSIPAGQTETVRVELSKRGKKLFKANRMVTANATCTTTAAGGTHTHTENLKIKRAKRN
jgi:hypothetical protein